MVGFGGAANNNNSDAKYFIENFVGTRFGDADLGGDVDADDLTALGLHWLLTGIETWEDGDFNGDGSVDAGDLNLLGQYWQWGVPIP